MKNTLAENMLRFGVKNLSESNIKKINEALLTEAIDLSNDKRLPKVAMALKTQVEKGNKFPSAVMGQFLFKVHPDQPVNWDSATAAYGSVIAFQQYFFPGFGTAVGLPLYPVGYGGNFYMRLPSYELWSANYEAQETNVRGNTYDTNQVAEFMNLVNRIPIDQIQAIWNANPNKANFAKTMSAFVASDKGRQVMALVTGNAKTFYASMVTTPAAPVQAKPGVPVKQP